MSSPDRQAAFDAFHAEHGDVYRVLVQQLRRGSRAGRTPVSMDLLWARMQWFISVERNQADHPVMQPENDFRAEYEAMLAANDPGAARSFGQGTAT